MEQRIDGFRLIEAFYSWVFNNPDKARATHVSLYLFLWNQNNRAHWVEWFKCPYDLAMQGACIGNNGTYYKCLGELRTWGLIDYQKGINNYKAPIVKLLLLYNSAISTEQVSVPLSEQQSVQQTEQLPAHIYKLITDNIEQITNNYNKFEGFIHNLSKTKNKDVSKEDIEQVYKAYPTKCPTKGSGTGKSEKDKEKIKSLLLHTPTDKLLAIIQSYVSDCTKNRVYMKNFKTFLNNIPDVEEEEEPKEIGGYDFDAMFPQETLSDNTKRKLKLIFDDYAQKTGKQLADEHVKINFILDLDMETLIRLINANDTGIRDR